MNLFVVAAVILTCLAVAPVVWPLLRKSDDAPAAPVAAFVLGLGMPAAVLLIYLSVSNHDWSAPMVAQGERNSEAVGSIAEMVTQLENRLQAEPGDARGWLLLGRTYAQLQRIADSKRAYTTAMALEPSSEAKLGVAEADILLDRSNLLGDAGRLVEEVLTVEPQNAKALFYGGMISMARNDVETFRDRWQLLLTMSPPDEIRALIESQLAQAGFPPDAPTAGTDSAMASVDVNISIAAGLAERIKPGAIMFLLAREPNRPGPPVAVIRHNASELPATLNLSDKNAMMAGRSLSSLPRVQLVARITNSGEPVAQPGDLYGEMEWMTGSSTGEGISIVIDRVVD